MSNVPNNPHVAVTSLRDGGAVEQGSVVVHQPSCSTTVLEAIESVCRCHLAWRPHAVYRRNVILPLELTASSAASLGRGSQSPHSDVAWLEPHQYCWVPVATNVTSSDALPQGDKATNVALASHGSPTRTGAIYGTVPETLIVGAAAYLLHTPPSAGTVHVVDASIIGVHLRRAQDTLYCGIKGRTSHLDNQHALSWIVEGLQRLPRRFGGPHHWVVRQSSHLAAVPLEAPESAAASATAPPVHILLPKEHAILLVPGDDGEPEPHVPSMQTLQHVREMEWRSLAARTRAHTHQAAPHTPRTSHKRPPTPHGALPPTRKGHHATQHHHTTPHPPPPPEDMKHHSPPTQERRHATQAPHPTRPRPAPPLETPHTRRQLNANHRQQPEPRPGATPPAGTATSIWT